MTWITDKILRNHLSSHHLTKDLIRVEKRDGGDLVTSKDSKRRRGKPGGAASLL